MALPTQGLGIVGTTIRNGGVAVASHLQFINWSNQHEIEIDNDVLPLDWILRIDQVDPATFSRPVSDFAFTSALDLGGRLADNVWQVAIQATESMDAAGLTYEVLSQNSNSFINSLMLSIGINIDTYLDTVTPDASGAGFVGVDTDVRNKVTFNIAGTSGDDWFFAGAKNDTLNGGAGNDIYAGGGGNDLINLGIGQDYAEGGAGADSLLGGDGSDTLSYNASSTAVVIYLGYNYAIGGDAAGDTISGFENVIGANAGSDLLVGDALANIIMGQGGADTLMGQAGADFVVGGAGTDSLIGGAGSDYYYGGSSGSDYFFLNYGDVQSGDIDYLADFSASEGDLVILPAATKGSLFYSSYGNYAFCYVPTSPGYYVFGAANTTVADLQSHLYFV